MNFLMVDKSVNIQNTVVAHSVCSSTPGLVVAFEGSTFSNSLSSLAQMLSSTLASSFCGWVEDLHKVGDVEIVTTGLG